MQDNIFINSLFSDKKSAQLSNQAQPLLAKLSDDLTKPQNLSQVSGLAINNSIPQNSNLNGSPKNSPKQISLNQMTKTPPQHPFTINNPSHGGNIGSNAITLPNPAIIEKEKWLSLESNEIYVIRNESISKANEWIYYKLQREKFLNKRTNPFAEKTEEEKIKADMNNFRRSFLITKDMCSLLTNTKRKLQKKQEKLKKAVDNLSKEVKLKNLSMIKDLEVAKHYMYDMAKDNMRRRPNQNVKAQEESENK